MVERKTYNNNEKAQVTDIAYHARADVNSACKSLGYDGAGNLLGNVQVTNGDTGKATTTTYQYKFLGRYLQSQSHTQQESRSATTSTWHDANGFISNITQDSGVADMRFNRTFVNDAQGNALYVNQGAAGPDGGGGRIQNLPGGYIGGFIGTALYPGHVQRQLVANGEVMARFGDAPDSQNPPANASEKPKYINTAEFHLDAAPLQLKGANF